MDNKLIISEDEEQLRNIANNIRKYSLDLSNIKEKADLEWSLCSKFLDESVTKNINLVKNANNKKYLSDIEKLDNYANKIEFVSNVLKDTELEIIASSKRFESMFEKINQNLSNIFNDHK